MASVKHNRIILTNLKAVTSDISVAVSDFGEQQKIFSSDAQLNDNFGVSSAMNGAGNVIIIGDQLEDTPGTSAGAAYTFTKNSSDIWGQTQKIQSSDIAAGDRFGIDVTMNYTGNIAAIGAYLEATPGASAGAVYIFTKNSSDIWSQTQKIQSSDISGSDRFGFSVSMNAGGTTLVVGAPIESSVGLNAGAAYVFTKNSSDIWSEQQKIISSDLQGGDNFGWSVTVNSTGDIVMVGAMNEDTISSNAGATYVFTKNSSDVWNEIQKLYASDASVDDEFGFGCKLNDSGDLAIISAVAADNTGAGSSGAAYIFVKNSSNIWGQTQKITSSDIQAGDRFGQDLALNSPGDVAIVGAYLEDTPGSSAGAAYTFTKNSSDIWGQTQKIQSSDIAAGAEFGRSVATNSLGTIFVVGATDDSGIASAAGAGYVFQASTSVITPIGGVVYDDVSQYELYRMKSDNVVTIKP